MQLNHRSQGSRKESSGATTSYRPLEITTWVHERGCVDVLPPVDGGVFAAPIKSNRLARGNTVDIAIFSSMSRVPFSEAAHHTFSTPLVCVASPPNCIIPIVNYIPLPRFNNAIYLTILSPSETPPLCTASFPGADWPCRLENPLLLRLPLLSRGASCRALPTVEEGSFRELGCFLPVPGLGAGSATSTWLR